MLHDVSAWLLVALLTLLGARAAWRAPAERAPRSTLGQIAWRLVRRFPRLELPSRPLVRLLGWLNRRVPVGALDLGLAVLVAAVSFGAWSFAEAMEGLDAEEGLYAVDTWLERRIYDGQMPPLASFSAWLSEITRPLAVGVFVVGVTGALLARRRPVEAIGLAAAAAGTGLLTTLAKDVTARPRPLGNAEWAIASMAFPSGHTSGTAAVALFLAWLLTRHRPPAARMRAYAAALAFTGLTALSRLYLVVHWLSDVIAGMALGFGWSALCILGVRAWQDRRGAAAPAAG